MIIMGLDLAPRRLSLISAYVPQSRRAEEERTDFVDELAGAIEKCQTKGAVIVLGDFNARIHARLNGEEDRIGPHIYGAGVEKLQDGVWEQGGRTNRDLVMELCAAQGLKIMNTWFRKPESRKVTHRAPGVAKLPTDAQGWDPAFFAELDLCLTPNRWAGMVKNVESTTWAHLNTDHFPLEVTLALRLRAANKKGSAEDLIRYDFRAATDEALDRYGEIVGEAAQEAIREDTLGEAWIKMDKAVKGPWKKPYQGQPRSPGGYGYRRARWS